MLMDVSCMKCSRPAVVHLTDISAVSNGRKEIVRIHLCMKHAVEAGVIGSLPVSPGTEPENGPQEFDSSSDMEFTTDESPTNESGSLDGLDLFINKMQKALLQGPPEFLAKKGAAADIGNQANSAKCPQCGTTWDDFRRNGVMGCPFDYQLFESQLRDVLDGLHEGRVEHLGKVPVKAAASEAALHARAVRLQTRLAEALAQEKYEEAARLRDELRHIT